MQVKVGCEFASFFFSKSNSSPSQHLNLAQRSFLFLLAKMQGPNLLGPRIFGV